MSDILDRIHNWARAFRPGYVIQTCGSAEGNYRSNWRQWVALQDIPHSEPIDLIDAQRVETAWKGMVSRKHKEALRHHFIYQCPNYVVARKARCKVWQVQELLGNAIGSLNYLLQGIDITEETRQTSRTIQKATENRETFCP